MPDTPPSVDGIGKVIKYLGIIGVVIGLFLGLSAFEQVSEGNVGVITEKGKVTGEILQPGWHIINPVTQDAKTLSVRPKQYTMSKQSGEGQRASRNDQVDVLTNDGLNVGIDITIRYEIQSDKADTFYTEYRGQQRAETRLIRPTIRAELRTEGGAIDTNNIYTKSGQEKLKRAVTDVLEDEFEGTGLKLKATQIRAVDLPRQYQNSIEQKVVERQKVQQKRAEINRTRLEKERKRIEAEASAEQINIRGEALRENKIVLRQRRIEALKEAETIYVPSDGVALTEEADGQNRQTAQP
jgi:regulator of protease activity HflC (stomatin/prohibitin superfamily)